jgi:LysM repeat protein
MRLPHKAVFHASAVLIAVAVLAACSTDVSGTATTVVAVESTNFQTIPPVSPTTVPVTTTLPIGAVGVEQSYSVRPGDSPSLVATLFGLTMSELLMYNGLVASGQFPFPGSILKIPPSAMVLNPVITVAPDVAAGPAVAGCDARPAGTYQIAAGDSIYVIRKKFCVSLASLLAANNWPSQSVNIRPGQIINIPASGS